MGLRRVRLVRFAGWLSLSLVLQEEKISAVADRVDGAGDKTAGEAPSAGWLVREGSVTEKNAALANQFADRRWHRCTKVQCENNKVLRAL